MTITHLLDTSVYSQPLRKIPLASVQRHWEKHGDEKLCISVLCEAEIIQGLEAKGSRKLWMAYKEILEGRLEALHVDQRVAQTYARLAVAMDSRGLRRPVMDLLIAATAKASGLILATINYRDFQPIEGLAVEDWSR